jgi:hypothetical protein
MSGNETSLSRFTFTASGIIMVSPGTVVSEAWKTPAESGHGTIASNKPITEISLTMVRVMFIFIAIDIGFSSNFGTPLPGVS